MSDFPDFIEPVILGAPILRDHPEDGARFQWCASHCELMMAFEHLRPAEVEAISAGAFEFGLTVIDQMPFVCFRVFQAKPSKGFGRPRIGKLVWPWQECPLHLSRFDPDTLPAFDDFRATPNVRLAIAVILAERPSLVVKALRYFTLSPSFTQALIDALLSTVAAHTREGYEAAVRSIYAAYPPNGLGEQCQVRCWSGD